MARSVLTMTIVATLAVTGSLWTAGTLSAATVKPTGDYIGTDLHVLTWGFPLADPGIDRGKAIVVTNPDIVTEVRNLINSLPFTVPNPRQMCPMDLVLSPAMAFSVSRRSPMVTRVVVQLGGCPYARVYQRGTAISPTLGGPHLAGVFDRIQRLVNPRGISLY